MSTLSIHAKSFDPVLASLLSEVTENELIEVIVTYENQGPVTLSDLNTLDDIGINTGVVMENLPIVGVLATHNQINDIYSQANVRSIWHNQQLSLENDGSTEITGVDRLRNDPNMRNMGMPFSGRGIGVVINDSGVDGTHNDIKFPNHTVQNVLAQTNLRSFSDLAPITYQEDIPNTDIAGGHGSHVAGIIGGNGAMSSGRYAGVAPGAKLIGYGSGAGLFILDTIGGFDYTLTHQFDYNIRVISNSFGSTSDTGTDFNPDHPTNVATKALADRGVIVVFSAGNSGSGEATITGNFKKAPWVVTVAAGDKNGELADFSSRGVKGHGGNVVVSGEIFEWVDRPTVTAPGVDVISVRDSLSSLGALSFQDDADQLEPAHLPYYTISSGTSMSAPHVSGIVALMLEADPTLNWRAVKQILQDTATNMPGREAWEAGAGYVNAYAAVQSVLDRQRNFGETVKINRNFNAMALTSVAGEFAVDVPFSPVGENEGITFEVSEDISLIFVRANVSDNTVALSLYSPSGKRYGSSIALPVIGQNIAVTAPAEPGTWTLKAGGIGGVSGVDVDPTGQTNGYAAPGDVAAYVKFIRTDGFSGISDVSFNHPARSFVEFVVSKQLMDATLYGFEPDALLSRGELADYLTLTVGVRQSNSAAEGVYSDVPSSIVAAVNSVTELGASLSDRAQTQDSLMMPVNNDLFNPFGKVNKQELAYSLIQGKGLESEARNFDSDIVVVYNGESISIEDQDLIAEEYKGYVQFAISMGILPVEFTLEQGQFDFNPVIKAYFKPNKTMTRADFAAAATRYYIN
ncbi:S8 family serine peptidase [Marinicella litoralis]|uniref:S8 family serine peptidase n=1 Tax=Marinicella litoralis TaxID=644220 RepID=UPI001FE63CB3|nr:S8 family serine peptidase [Marinicella litoralis]